MPHGFSDFKDPVNTRNLTGLDMSPSVQAEAFFLLTTLLLLITITYYYYYSFEF